jgi:hypothetical protein
MRKIPIDSLIQLLGMVGIIGSLIFVGLEMQQTQRIAIASAQETRMNAIRVTSGVCRKVIWMLNRVFLHRNLIMTIPHKK